MAIDYVEVSGGERNIPRGVRRAVIERDGPVCQACGGAAIEGARGPQALHLDHILPWAAGGEHTLENLRVSCASCNLSRRKPLAIRGVRPRERWEETRAQRRRRLNRAEAEGIIEPPDRTPTPELLAMMAEAKRLSARQRRTR